MKLCLENVPFSGNLELDGLFCISNDDVSKQIVVKIHKVIQPSSANQGKNRSILKINKTAHHGTDECGKQKDTALVVEVRRGKVGDSITYKSERSCDRGNPAKDFIPANKSSDKSAKADSMVLEIPSNLTVASKNGSGIVDLSVNSPSTQDDTGAVGIVHIKEEQMQDMSVCDEEDSFGESLQIQDNDDIHSEMKCKHCQQNFSDLGDLETHFREKHGRFMCRQCLTTFSLSCNLRRHMKLHTGVRPHMCNSCNSSFSRSTDLRIHMKKHSSGKDFFSCSLCSVTFNNSYLLSQHKAKVHGSDEECFKCATCEKQFGSESNLILHRKVHRESCGSEVDRSALNQSPNMTSDEQDAVVAGDEDEMSFEDRSNCSGSPGLQSPASSMPHLARKVCLAKETVQHVEEKQNLPLDFKIKHFPSKLGKEMSSTYIETVKEFAPLFTIDDPDVANGSCGGDLVAKSSEDSQGALSLVQKRLSFATPAVGKNKRKGMPVKHIKLNENGTSYEMADGKVLHHNNESDVDSDGNVSSGNTASNCKGMIGKTNPKLQPNERNIDSSHDGLKDGEFSTPKLHKSAFPSHRNDAQIRQEKQGESCSASSDLSLNNNNNAENRIFTCRHGGCSTAWFGFAAYESHYISAHCRYPCELCDQSFTSRNNRRRHANGHGNAKRHNCDRCDKQFARPDIVKEHRITHTKSYQMGSCFKCDFACVKKTMLLSHLKRCLTAEDVDSDFAKH